MKLAFSLPCTNILSPSLESGRSSSFCQPKQNVKETANVAVVTLVCNLFHLQLKWKNDKYAKPKEKEILPSFLIETLMY